MDTQTETVPSEHQPGDTTVRYAMSFRKALSTGGGKVHALNYVPTNEEVLRDRVTAICGRTGRWFNAYAKPEWERFVQVGHACSDCARLTTEASDA